MHTTAFKRILAMCLCIMLVLGTVTSAQASGNATPLTITGQPASVTVREGATASTTVTAQGDGLSYTWYWKNADGAYYQVSSGTTKTYSTQMAAEKNGRTVYCVVTDQYGNSVTSNTATLRIGNAVKITAQPQSASAADGKTVSTSVTATGDGLTYAWYWKNAGDASYQVSSVTSNTYSTQMNAVRAGRKVYCVVTDKYGNSVTSAVATLTMASPLKITTQPQNASAADGKTVSTSVTATGEGLTYAWYWKNAADSDYYLSSVTANTYSTQMIAEKNGRTVYCVVTDKYGNSVTSSVATLTLASALKITSQPQNASAADGKTVSTSVKASGDGLSYKWYWKNAGSAAYQVSSVTTNTYSTPMAAEKNGRTVYCVITDKYGNSVTSSVATLTLKGILITAQPQNASAANGKTVSTSVTATGEGLSYKWYWKNAADADYYLSSVTSNTYSTQMIAEKNGRTVYCVITDKYGNSVTSSVATLSVMTPLKITTQPQNASAANGKTASTSVTAQGDGLSYKWYWKNADGAAYQVSSVTTNTYATPMAAEKNGRKVYCVVTDKYGNSVTSSVATLTLKGILITAQPQNASAAEGKTVSTSVTAIGEGLTYTWYWKNVDGAYYQVSSGTTSTYSTPMAAEKNGRTVYCVITDKHGNSVTSSVATLTMTTPLTITAQPKNAYVHAGETATATVAAQGDGLTYQWYFTYSGAGNTFEASSVTAATYSTTLTSAKDGRKVYCVITDRYGNSVQSHTAELHIIDTVPEKLSYVVNTTVKAGMSQYETALSLYDWVCANVTYDDDYLVDNVPTSSLGVGGEAALLDGIAVCHGFAQAYEWLLEEVGIAAHYVTGYANYNGAAHAWNLAKLDDKWYQFDPTWDDDGNGETHNYFGLSDYAMNSNHTQETHTHILCNDYDANYNYQQGHYDEVLAYVKNQINAAIKNNVYSGSVDVSAYTDYLFWWYPDHATVATILVGQDDWAKSGRVEVYSAEPCYNFSFYPDEKRVEHIEIIGVTEGKFATGYVGSSYYYLYTGYKGRPQIITEPAGAALSFSSSNPAVLTVDNAGNLCAVAEGTAILSISAQNYLMRLPICVSDEDFSVSDKFLRNLAVGESSSPSFSCRRRSFADLSGTWTVEDSSVAAIVNGKLTARKNGQTTITGKLGDMSYTYTVTVRDPITKLTSDKNAYTATVGGDDLEVNIYLHGTDPALYRDNYTYMYVTPSDDSVVAWSGYYTTWEENGVWCFRLLLDPLKAGTATVTVEPLDESGVTYTFTVTVK
ncbi:MAG: hypothetical protein E7326_04990 [Clostridiales bacterium]|nr:hypothetical protein [Clostridiales bacterium]